MVFSGGVSNGAYQIGFAKALLSYVSRSDISLITGSSAGMLTAYALSADKLDYLEMLYRKVDITKTGELLWQVFAKGLLTDYLNTLVNCKDKLEIPVCFPVCYIPIFSVKYYWIYKDYNRVWQKYIDAAINYPFLKILPSFLNGRFAIDGGACDNIPLYPMLKANKYLPENEKADIIFVLHFDARYDYRREFKTDIPVLDLDLSICNNFSKSHYDYSWQTVDERISKAYAYGIDICEKIFGGNGTKKHFQKAITDIFIAEHSLRQQNFSLDRLFSFLNVAGKALRNDSRCIKKLY